MFYMKPVSYTHLDVYKRQVAASWAGYSLSDEAKKAAVNKEGSVAVSYTHLDVYKRQALRS